MTSHSWFVGKGELIYVGLVGWTIFHKYWPWYERAFPNAGNFANAEIDSEKKNAWLLTVQTNKRSSLLPNAVLTPFNLFLFQDYFNILHYRKAARFSQNSKPMRQMSVQRNFPFLYSKQAEEAPVRHISDWSSTVIYIYIFN